MISSAQSEIPVIPESVSCKCLNIRFNYLSLFLAKEDLNHGHGDNEVCRELDGQEDTCIGHDHAGDLCEPTPGFEESDDVCCESPSSLSCATFTLNDKDDAPIISLFSKPKFVKPNYASSLHCGAQVTIPYLMTTKEVARWKLFACFICKTLTHAISPKNEKKVLVNFGEMLQQSQQYSVISHSANYSELFGVVALSAKGNVERSSSLKPSVMDVIRDLKERATYFIENEKALMKKRIREFESAQNAMFQDLESAISISKVNLENQIVAAYNEANDDVDSAFERSVEEIYTSSVSSQEVSMGGKSERSSSIVDEMFDLDPFADDDVDDDDIFTDDESQSAVPNYQSRNNNAEDSDILAKSVPIPIMRRMRVSTTGFSGSSSDDGTTPNPQDMQASIRALAQSVGGDGTEMFGDLPRPRFNTYTRRSHQGDY